MRLAILSLVALGFLTADMAGARGIRWASSFDEALKEAKERGVLVLCILNMSDPPEPANEAMIQMFASSKSVEKACRGFVCVWANPHRHREIKAKVDGKTKDVCPNMGNLPCRVHREMEKIVTRRYGETVMGKDGYVRAPVQWIVDGDGEVVETIANGDADVGFDPVAEGDFVARLAAVARKHGPGLTSDEYHKLCRLLEEGNELEAAGDHARAAGKFRELLRLAPKKVASVEQAEAALAEIAALGRKGIEEADALAKAGTYAGAMAKLREIARVFRNSDAATEAKARLDELKKNPDVARMIRESQALEASAKLLATGQSAEKAENWKKALDAYTSCSEKYPETEAGQAARTRLEKLLADPKIGTAMREAAAAKDSKSWINLARNFISNNLPDRARIYLRKVIDTYPGTSYARKAQEMLNGLK